MSTTSRQNNTRAGGALEAGRGSNGHREPQWAVRSDGYAERHVYLPHRIGLPPLGAYLRLVYQRREFAFELSRTNMRAKHFDTVFGQLWLLLNPLLLGLIYFLLVDLLRGHGRPLSFFAHLLGGLFAYQIVQTAATEGSKSVVKGGGLILNTAFPRTLLPLAAVATAFKRFVPTLMVYFPIHVAAGLGLDLEMLWALPILAMITLLAAGVAMFVAAAEVYFRDLSSFLPYLLRIWLYVSPVLYYWEDVPHSYRPWLELNPLASMLASWSDVLNKGMAPSLNLMAAGLAWALFASCFGALFFISRERDFAVRI